MRITLADEFKAAYAKAGQELPGAKVPSTQKAAFPNPAKKQHPANKKPSQSKKTFPSKKPDEARLKHLRKIEKEAKGAREKARSDSQSPLGNGPDLSYEVTISDTALPQWKKSRGVKSPTLLEFPITGQQAQPELPNRKGALQDRSLVIGLDFGTSCTKVVVGDPALGKAFAVPFFSNDGLTGLLLPCHLYQRGKTFSLTPGDNPADKGAADLKLAFLAHPDDITYQSRVVAFLALVVRRTRAWLFTNQAAIYRSNNIVWRLAMGFPTANHLNPRQTDNFRVLGIAAWVLAGSNLETIDDASASKAIIRAKEIDTGAIPSAQEDVEVSVVPEIAAQIYGYVASESFDENAANNFMIVDIGAGTVDASLFHVKRRRGKWDFEFYTASVEPHGTVNLHRNRLGWLTTVIRERHSQRQDLLASIEESMHESDAQSGFPESLKEYLSDTEIKFASPKGDIDRQFYSKVITQIGHETYWKASRGHLAREALTNLPVYLCGGGARMSFYSELSNTLVDSSRVGLSEWMKMSFRRLTLPKMLVAPGLPKEDFDRLSVAYGLSFLDLGAVLKSIAKPAVPIQISDKWRDNYVDKSEC